MKRIILACALACAFFVPSASSQCDCDGGNWYVDNAVSTSGNGQSWAGAWKNFANIVWGSVQPGDTIYISGGSSSKTYIQRLVVGKSGTSGAPITITPGVDAGHSGTVIIDGQNARQCANTNGKSHVVLQNLTGKNTNDTCVYVNGGGAGVLVQGWEIYASGPGGGNSRGIDIRHTTGGAIIRNNEVTTNPNTTDQTDCFYAQNNTGGVLIEGNSCIQANADTTGHSDCYQLYDNGDVTLRGNFCQSAALAPDNHGFWTSATRSGGTYRMFNNVTDMGNTATAAMTHWNPSSTWTGRAVFYNNTIFGGTRGINCERTPSTSTIKNNIVWPRAGGVGMYLVNCPIPAANINNNLIYAPSATVARVNGSAKTWAGWRALGFDAAGVNANPLFQSGSFALQSGSPAINAGATLPEVTTDFAGTPRPQGPAYDIGAYEWVAP